MTTTSSTRRKFLHNAAAAVSAAAVGAAAVGAAALPRVCSAGEPRQPPDPWGGFTVGVQSYSYRRFTFERALEQIQDMGLRHVELFRGHVPTSASETQIQAARNLCEKHRITPIAFGVENFTKDHEANRRLFEFGRRLGIRYLSANPSEDSFDSLDKLVAEFNIGIAIHPHGPIDANKRLDRWYSAEVIMKAVRDRHRLIGSCLDTGHLIRCAQNPFNEKLDPAQQIRTMGARNFGLHLKDHDNARRTDVVFGRGVLNVPEVLRSLRAVKFQGYISIEYEANENNPTPDIRACLDVFREAVRKL